MIEYRAVKKEEWELAMEMVWKTFQRFNAPEYSQEGVESFYKFIINPLLEDMFIEGSYITCGAYEDDRIVGFGGYRNKNFLSMLFVDENYQNMGIATRLVDVLSKDMIRREQTVMRVNSSPYAIGFYENYGFVAVDERQISVGVEYLPMELDLTRGHI